MDATLDKVMLELKQVAVQMVAFGLNEWKSSGPGLCVAEFDTVQDAQTETAPSMTYLPVTGSFPIGIRKALKAYDPKQEVVVKILVEDVARVFKLGHDGNHNII
jgi:hypothetical protein